MLLVRFSFCENGSIVCGSPRPAQRSVFASATSAPPAKAIARSAASARGAVRGMSVFSGCDGPRGPPWRASIPDAPERGDTGEGAGRDTGAPA